MTYPAILAVAGTCVTRGADRLLRAQVRRVVHDSWRSGGGCRRHGGPAWARDVLGQYGVFVAVALAATASWLGALGTGQGRLWPIARS